MKHRALPIVAIVMAASVCRAHPQSDPDAHWASWRGPLGTGGIITGNPPLEWAEATVDGPAKNIAWKVPIPGLGISSPIVWGDRIYLTTAVATDREGKPSIEPDAPDHRAVPHPTVVHEFWLMAISRRDGRTLWRTKLTEAVPHEGGHATNSFASSSPTTDGEVIAVNLGSRGVFTTDMEGDVLWSKQLGALRTRRQYGEAISPTIHGDSVIINQDHEGDSFIAILDRKTGAVRWRKARDEVTSWSTPIVVNVDGRDQVIVNATTASRGYDLQTGEVVWWLGGMTVNTIPAPIHRDGVVYLMSGYRGNMLQAVRLAGARGDLAGTKNVVWTHERSTSYVPSAALHGEELYFVRKNNGVLNCVDAATGKVRYEGQRLSGLRSIYASPVCVADRVYVTSRDGATMVIAAGPEFRQLALNRLDDEVDASAAIVGDALYVRGRKHLYCIKKTSSSAPSPPKEGRGDSSKGRRSLEVTASFGDEERTASVSAGDLDGDGDADLIFANGRHWPDENLVLTNGGHGTFAARRPLGDEAAPTYEVALGDVDGDGDLDAVVANDRKPSRVLVNDGKGRFAPGSTVGRISNTRSVHLADLDGKDGLDVIFVNRRQANLICFNDGKGGFARQTVFGGADDATIRVATGDVDGDGDLDIAVANRNGQPNHVYLNDGEGRFTRKVPYGTGADNTRGVAVADIDGDGHLDVLNANIGQPDAIHFGDGKGGFPRTVTLEGAARGFAIAAADIDGDGRLDVVIGNVRAPNTLHRQRPDGTFESVAFGPPDGVTYGVTAADVDGDGRPEVLTANSDGPNRLFAWRR